MFCSQSCKTYTPKLCCQRLDKYITSLVRAFYSPSEFLRSNLPALSFHGMQPPFRSLRESLFQCRRCQHDSSVHGLHLCQIDLPFPPHLCLHQGKRIPIVMSFLMLNHPPYLLCRKFPAGVFTVSYCDKHYLQHGKHLRYASAHLQSCG